MKQISLCDSCKKLRYLTAFKEGSKNCKYCRGKHRKDVAQYRIELRKEVFEHYSEQAMNKIIDGLPGQIGVPRCSKCGYARNTKALLIRAEGRRTLGIKLKNRGSAFLAWLKAQGYPPGFMVICANCCKVHNIR